MTPSQRCQNNVLQTLIFSVILCKTWLFTWKQSILHVHDSETWLQKNMLWSTQCLVWRKN